MKDRHLFLFGGDRRSGKSWEGSSRQSLQPGREDSDIIHRERRMARVYADLHRGAGTERIDRIYVFGAHSPAFADGD